MVLSIMFFALLADGLTRSLEGRMQLSQVRYSKWHADFADFEEGYLRHYIAFADTKAAVVFGVTSTLIGFLLANKNYISLIESGVYNVATLLAVLACMGLAVSAIFAISVVIPRLPKGAEGIIFYGAIQRLASGDAYQRKVKACGEDDLIDARLDHCYTLSGICWKKYICLRAAIWIGLLSMIVLLPNLRVIVS